MTSENIIVLLTSLGTVLGIVNFFFGIIIWQYRDAKRKYDQELVDIKVVHEKEVKKLWEKHDEDAAKLQKLELTVAGDYNTKTEIAKQFSELKDSINSMGKKFDRVSEILLQGFLTVSKTHNHNVEVGG